MSKTHIAILSVLFMISACSSATQAASGDSGTSRDAPAAVNPQEPPTSGAALETWLATGDYKSWHCETAAHAARAPSPHGMDRVCSNDLTSSFTGAGERPVGSASVKELYDTGGPTVTGYAVYVKAAATSDGGTGWYWYERRSTGVVADGFGNAGGAKTICVGCHSNAASSSAHPGASDFVWTEVR